MNTRHGPNNEGRLVGRILAKRLSSNKTMYNALLPVAEDRIQEKALQKLGQKVEKHVCAAQYAMPRKRIPLTVHAARLHPMDHGDIAEKESLDRSANRLRTASDLVRFGACHVNSKKKSMHSIIKSLF